MNKSYHLTGLEKFPIVGSKGKFLIPIQKIISDLGLSDGEDGKSAYDLYVQESVENGSPILSIKEWLDSLQGEKGEKGDIGLQDGDLYRTPTGQLMVTFI